MRIAVPASGASIGKIQVMNSEERHAALMAYMQRDTFAKWLGITIEEMRPGYGRASMTVTGDMLNFHGLTHGGAVGALGDVAFAIAANSHGQVAVGISINMSLQKSTSAGSRLTAEARELSLKGPLGLYEVIVRDETGDIVAHTQGQTYRKREHFLEMKTGLAH